MHIDCPVQPLIDADLLEAGAGRISIRIAMRRDTGAGRPEYCSWTNAQNAAFTNPPGSTLQLSRRLWLVQSDAPHGARAYQTDLVTTYHGPVAPDASDILAALTHHMQTVQDTAAALGWNIYEPGHPMLHRPYRTTHEAATGKGPGSQTFFAAPQAYRPGDGFSPAAALSLDCAGQQDPSGRTPLLTGDYGNLIPTVSLESIIIQWREHEEPETYEPDEAIPIQEGPAHAVTMRIRPAGRDIIAVPLPAMIQEGFGAEGPAVISVPSARYHDIARMLQRLPPESFGIEGDDDDAQDEVREKSYVVAAKAAYCDEWRLALPLHRALDYPRGTQSLPAPAKPVTLRLTDRDGKAWLLTAHREGQIAVVGAAQQPALFDEAAPA